MGRTRLTPTWTCLDCSHAVQNPLVITRCPNCGGRQGSVSGIPKTDWPQATFRVPPGLDIELKLALDDLGRSAQQFFERAVIKMLRDPRGFFKGD